MKGHTILLHIRDSIGRIRRHTRGGRAEFFPYTKAQRSPIRARMPNKAPSRMQARITIALFLAGLLLPTALAQGGARPTPQQLLWHDCELGMFIHFAPNTWLDREYDDLSLPLEKFNPDRLDTDQWVAAAEEMGAKYIVFVAKHAGGFCLWPTETTDYSIRNTPWRGGKGDILADLAESCRKRGLRLGVYLSPADRKHGAGVGGKIGGTPPEAYYPPEAGSKPKPGEVVQLTQQQYNDLYRRQLVEVFTTVNRILGPVHGDAAVFEVWFDGSIVVPVGDLLEKHAPKAMIFQGPHATIRWVGNEDGTAPYPAWNAVSEKDARSGEATARHGTPDGDVWLPNECDARFRNTWFWNTKNAETLKSVAHLVDLYERSVGHGAVLLLNHTPDPTGRIPDADVKRGAEFAAEIHRRYGTPLAESAGEGDVLELVIPASRIARPPSASSSPTEPGVARPPSAGSSGNGSQPPPPAPSQAPPASSQAPPAPSAEVIDRVILMEDLSGGERVREYVLEGRLAGAWRELCRGTAIGHKKIDRFAPAAVEAVRLRITKFAARPLIRRFAVFAGS